MSLMLFTLYSYKPQLKRAIKLWLEVFKSFGIQINYSKSEILTVSKTKKKSKLS